MSRVREWWRSSQATEEERRRPMLGDAYVTLPSHHATLGVTIQTAPAAIGPWLLQMGYRRGGLRSHDWLDRLFGYLDRPSADSILPEWQQRRVGDEIRIGNGGAFPVRAIEPRRSLVLLLGIRQRAEAVCVSAPKEAA
jgi:hypothetical protein